MTIIITAHAAQRFRDRIDPSASLREARAELRSHSRAAIRLFDPDVPEAGFYKMRLRSGGVPVGVHIFYGQTRDPESGEPIERWAWQVTINGEPGELARVWPMCAHEPVEQAEHDYLVRLQDWGRRHDPDGFHANPTRKVDLLSAPLPF